MLRDNEKRRRDFHSPNNVIIDLTKFKYKPNTNINDAFNTRLVQTVYKPSTYINKSSKEGPSNNTIKNFNKLKLLNEKKFNTDNKKNLLTPQKPNVKGTCVCLDDFKPNKQITPMHLKLYESTQQEVNI